MCRNIGRNKKLFRRCNESLALIEEEIIRSSVPIPDNKKAWGQFLDYSHSIEQTGVYGTATAIKTLSILGKTSDSDYIKGGVSRLLQSYNDADSRASTKRDWGVIYKLCYFLEALEPNSPEINEGSSFASYFHALIERILHGDGWGEYYYSNTAKDSNTSDIATAMALYALRRFVPFSGSAEGRDIVSRFCQRVLGLSNPNSITIALSTIVVATYAERHQSLKDDLTRLTGKLEGKVHKLSKSSSLSEYHHHFSVGDIETGQWNNRYIFLPINAIVSYALILSNNYKNNRNYVNRAISLYVESILCNKAYCEPEEAPLKSTVNQYWVALLLSTFKDIQPIGMLRSILSSIKRNRLIYYPSLIVISLGILAILFFTIPKLQNDPEFNAVPFILVLIADFIIHRIWYKGN